MASKTVLLLIFWLLNPCYGANDTCIKTQCKLMLTRNDLSSEFRSKSTKLGVRMVYLNLKVAGNESYNPLQSHDKFQPSKWTWARDIGEPMLSFSYQYQVLSLGILSNQVRNMEVVLNEEPTGCLADLTSSCKDRVVGRTLLEKVVKNASSNPRQSLEDVVCVSVIRRDLHWLTIWYYGNIEYQCCNIEKRGNETLVHCNRPVEGSIWFNVFNHTLVVIYFFLCLFWPVRLLILPDYLFKFTESDEEERHKKLIPVDDFSPITCLTFLNKCTERFKTAGNFSKLFCLYYIFIPYSVYLYLVLHFTLLLEFLNEIEAKRAFQDSAMFYYVFDVSKLYCLLPAIVLYAILPGMFIFSYECKPQFVNQLQNDIRENLKLLPKSVSSHSSFISSAGKTNGGFLGPYEITKSSLEHLYSNAEEFSNRNRCVSKVLKVLFYLNYVFAIVIYALMLVLYGAVYAVVGAIFLLYCVLRSVAVIMKYSPSFTLLKFLAHEIVKSFSDGGKSPETLPQNPKRNVGGRELMLQIFAFSLSFLWVSYYALLACLSCNFFAKMYGFVIMGLIINAQRTIPYVLFTYVLINNLSTSYNNFQNRFKEVKETISKHWHEKDHCSLQNSEVSANTIPRDLFWYVCDEPTNVLPLVQEVSFMVVFTLIILGILLLAFTTIVFFGEEYNNSPLISAAVVLLSGRIPDMLFKGLSKRGNFQGWDKIQKEKKIKEAVNKFKTKKNASCQVSIVWESSV